MKISYLICVSIGAFVMAGCSSEAETQQAIQEHPIKELIPYIQEEHILIDQSKNYDQLQNPPEKLVPTPLQVMDYPGHQ